MEYGEETPISLPTVFGLLPFLLHNNSHFSQNIFFAPFTFLSNLNKSQYLFLCNITKLRKVALRY